MQPSASTADESMQVLDHKWLLNGTAKRAGAQPEVRKADLFEALSPHLRLIARDTSDSRIGANLTPSNGVFEGAGGLAAARTERAAFPFAGRDATLRGAAKAAEECAAKCISLE